MSDSFSGSGLKCQNMALRSSQGVLVVVCGLWREGGCRDGDRDEILF